MSIAIVIWILSASLAAIFDKRATNAMPWPAVALIYDLMVLAALPLFLWAYRSELRAATVTAPGVTWSVAAGLSGQVACFAYVSSLKGSEASRVNAYGLLEVAVVALLGWAMLGEGIGWAKAGGIALMVIGAWTLGR